MVIPALDILQSMPVLGFFTFTVTLLHGPVPPEANLAPNERSSLQFHEPGQNMVSPSISP
jgi:hypothetical protein